MIRFGGIDKEFCRFEEASILLQPVPYDATSTWGKGADKGPAAFLEAAENMELYDIGSRTEVFREGIHTFDPVGEGVSPEELANILEKRASEMITSGKLPTFIGGEHSISIGITRAFRKVYPTLTVLQLDAHADLRPSYNGTPYSHACAMHEVSQNCNLVQVGIRSMDIVEEHYLDRNKCLFAKDIYSSDDWISRIIPWLTNEIYISVDLDVFDPSIMPSTGTPEPGGLDWHKVTSLLKEVFIRKNVVGFDINELAPKKGMTGPDFLAAKLYYKMLTYKFFAK